MKKPRSTPAAPTKAASATPASPQPSPFQAFLAGGVEPLTVTLSGPTSALVRWYCATTKHRGAEAVDGVVCGALTRARDSYEDDSGDEAFNFVLEDVLDCMNSFRLDRERMFVAGGGRVSAELDEQASQAVHLYAHHTGSNPVDVVNAAVLAEVPHVLDQLTKGPEDDDGPAIMREQVAAARRRRTGEDAPDARVVLSPLPASPAVGATHTVTLELSAEAHALLSSVAAYDGQSLEGSVRSSLAGTVTAWQERGTSPQEREEEVKAAFAAFGLAAPE